jgi:ribosome biogenesis GTPase
MPDIGALARQCKFYNCTHLHEPGCAVMAQVGATDSPYAISASRYKIYGELFEELKQPPAR